MRVLIVTPAAPGTRLGNRVTALRWQRILRRLGHRVTVTQRYTTQRPDVLIALHARRSHASIAAFHERYPHRPILVALTGTDIYGRATLPAATRASLAMAFRIIALQPQAAAQLPRSQRAKVRVILQSFHARAVGAVQRRGDFQAAVIGHLRTVKDPLRTAFAVRRLPVTSRIRVVQAGAALQPQWARRARAEMRRNPRYRWIGNLSAGAVERLMRASDLLVVTSRSEGGANVISEAIGLGLPVLASRIPGNMGLLLANYPGYFPVGDTLALRRLLLRAEGDADFLERLRRFVAARVPIFEPAAEQAAWKSLLAECAAPLPRVASLSSASGPGGGAAGRKGRRRPR